MRILLVEDEQEMADALLERIKIHLGLGQLIDHVIGHDHALELLKERTFDAVLVDLRIPSSDGLDDASIDFGKAVEAEAERLQPGALRLFVTANAADAVVNRLSAGQVDEHFTPGKPYEVVRYFQKDFDDIMRLMSTLERHQARLAELDALVLDGSDDLDIDSRRAVGIALSLAGGTQGLVTQPGGMAGCVNVLLECLGVDGDAVGQLFVKIGPEEAISQDLAGYQRIRFRWLTKALPSLAATLKFGFGCRHALVYSHAPSRQNLFDVCLANPALAATVVEALGGIIVEPSTTQARVLVGDLRRRYASDSQISDHTDRWLSLNPDEVEAVEVELSEVLQHGDLTGANVLVDEGGRPFLIDFGRTDVHPGPLDPVILELSFLFHPARGDIEIPTPGQCQDWAEGLYATGTSLAPVVRACREMASTQGYDPTALAAVGWAQAVRQLRYSDTSVEHALAIAESCAQVLRP